MIDIARVATVKINGGEKVDPFFRGYIETNGKKAVEKFKGRTDFKTYEQVERLQGFAGVLSDRAIVIDIDDYDQSEILMNIVEEMQLRCRVYETTRGKHFVFYNTSVDTCKTRTKLALGITGDIKIGLKNSYEVLKIDGVERPIIYDKFEDEDYEELPKWLLPVKTMIDFTEMGEGDGRNQQLFNYILVLQGIGLAVDEIRETIRLINSYILKNPLDDGELDIILRDEAFAKPSFYKGNTFLFDKFAVYLKENNHIVKINNQLHTYRDGVYVNGQNYIESQMITLIPGLKKAHRSEVLSYLDVLISDSVPMSASNYIAFKNGIYDLATDTFLDFSPDKILVNRLEYDYDPDVYSEICDRTLNKLACNDPQIRMLLEEVVGYTFYRRNELRKAFILIGDKANGKSTYLDMIKTLLGDNNTSALDLGELGDRFKTAELFGKLANIGDDIGDEFIPNPAVFKKLTSGDRLNVERKGQDPFDFNSYAKLLFSANNIPRIKDKTGAVLDRLVIIPFNATFSVNDPDYDPYIKYKLRSEESMQYLINVGLAGLKRVIENSRFTINDKVQKQLDDYEEHNNPIVMFFKEVSEDEIINEPTGDVYRKYQEFCIINGFQPISNIEFSKQTRRWWNLDIADKKIDGKKYRVFKRKGT
ncbi:MAG: hypothetical protein IKY67_06455 [Paludibacteraceae bacterium]|nr:hypothetical protein [Paludibacteraceae bacterium]